MNVEIENKFSLGHKVDHFCEIKFVGYSSIFNNRVSVSKKELDEILDYFHDQIEVLANENNKIKQTYKKVND